MLVRLQFILRIGSISTAVAWPGSTKNGIYSLTHNPLDSIGYGSEALAYSDVDNWLNTFPEIIDYEVTDFVGGCDARV